MKDILSQVVSEAQGALGENLVSIVLYGSRARDDAAESSDFNLFFVVRDHRPVALKPLRALVTKWAKKNVAPPVIFREDQIARSYDSFALEFAEIAAARRVLFGPDPFAAHAPDWEAVRRELEREARQKRIALTRRWLLAGDDERQQTRLLAEFLPGFLALMRAAVMAQKRQPQIPDFETVLAELSAWPSFQPEVWRKLYAAAKGTAKFSAAERHALLESLLEQAIVLVQRLDAIGA